MDRELKSTLINACIALLWGVAFGIGTSLIIVKEMYTIGAIVIVWGIVGEIATLILIYRGDF